MVYKCKTEAKCLNDCMAKWFYNDEFVKECQNKYLQDRREYRLTGVKKNPEQKMSS